MYMILNDDTQNSLRADVELEMVVGVFCPLSEKRWMTKKWLGKASCVYVRESVCMPAYYRLRPIRQQACF